MKFSRYYTTVFVGAAFALNATATKVDPNKGTADSLGNFGFKLFSKLSAEKPEQAIAISPLSIGEAMTLATIGSEKETKAALEDMLISPELRKLDIDVEMLVAGLKGTREALATFARDSKGAFEYSSANSIWGNNDPAVDFQFTRNYLGRAGKDFGAGLFERKFGNAAKDEMNAWVAKETKGKITKLISKLTQDDVAVLLNAIYAKGKFLNHFNGSEVGNYTNKSNQVAKASFLSKKDKSIAVTENKDFSMLSMAVGSQTDRGGIAADVALDIIVPKGDINELKAKLTNEMYSEAVEKLRTRPTDLSIVAGKVEQQEALSLKDAFTSDDFGAGIAFDQAEAQFQPMGRTADKSNIAISDVLTKTFYEVTPFGFEAAAATAVVMTRESVSIPEDPRFVKVVVDKPSLHVVRHVKTGLPMFIVEYDAPKLYTEKELVEFVKEGNKAHRMFIAKVKDGSIQNTYNQQTGKSVIAVVDAKGKIVRELEQLDR